MNRVQHEAMLEATKDMVRKLERRLPSCKTCNFYWPTKKGLASCEKWKTDPPPEVLKVGCDEWIDDAVPF